MADNYLERRMEDYRSGRGGSRRLHASSRSGRLSLPYPHQYVLVLGGDTPAGRAVLEAFSHSGATVAFTASADGAALAQQTGARYYPMTAAGAIADMTARGQRPDTLIICDYCPAPVSENGHPLSDSGHTLSEIGHLIIITGHPVEIPDAIVIVGADLAQAARIALIAAHPAATMPPQTILC